MSLYLATPGGVPNAGVVAGQRWQTVRRSLLDDGAHEGALAMIDPLVAPAHQHGECLAVIASDSGVEHHEYGPWPVSPDVGRWDSLAVLSPLVRWRQSSPAYVLVVTEGRGADITSVGRYAVPRQESLEVDDDRPLRKVAPGGWSQRRFQQRAENTWESHARQVAGLVERAADDVDAEIIVIAGDVRATELLERELPTRLVRRARTIAGGRSADGSDDRIEHDTHRWVATAAARSTVAVLDRFREELGQRDRAAEGARATVEALAMARVEVLLVHDDLHDDRRAWFGAEPTAIAMDPTRLAALGGSEGKSGRLIDVAIRAAVGSGGGVWVVPRAGGPAEGLGAILRW